MTLLSVVIPLNTFDERHTDCTKMIQAGLDFGCQVIIVVDSSSVVEQKQLASIFSFINDANFSVVMGDFGNPGSARNEGLKVSKGEWVTFWDSDDVGFPSGIIEDIKTNAKAHSVLIGNYSIEKINSKTQKMQIKNPIFAMTDEHMKQLTQNLGLWRMVFRRDRLGEIRFPPISMAEDKVFFALLNVDKKEIYNSGNEYYRYRSGSPKSLTGSKNTIGDLSSAIMLLKSQNFPRTEYADALLMRLSLTSIRRGNLELRMLGIVTLIKRLWT